VLFPYQFCWKHIILGLLQAVFQPLAFIESFLCTPTPNNPSHEQTCRKASDNTHTKQKENPHMIIMQKKHYHGATNPETLPAQKQPNKQATPAPKRQQAETVSSLSRRGTRSSTYTQQTHAHMLGEECARPPDPLTQSRAGMCTTLAAL
jgi:hypothetical protein